MIHMERRRNGLEREDMAVPQQHRAGVCVRHTTEQMHRSHPHRTVGNDQRTILKVYTEFRKGLARGCFGIFEKTPVEECLQNSQRKVAAWNQVNFRIQTLVNRYGVYGYLITSRFLFHS